VGEWILKEKKQALSTEHDAWLLNALGETADNMGDHREAILYFEQALAIWKKVYGEEHPQVATGLNNLGAAYFSLGDKKQSKSYLGRAYAIRLKFLGPDHPLSKQTAKGWTLAKVFSKRLENKRTRS
jgi:tetratricopeptide (TPR) repeat protein